MIPSEMPPRVADDVDLLQSVYADAVKILSPARVELTLSHQIIIHLAFTVTPDEDPPEAWCVDISRTERCDIPSQDFDKIWAAVIEVAEALEGEASAADLAGAASNALAEGGHARIPPPLPVEEQTASESPPSPQKVVKREVEPWWGAVLVGEPLKDRGSVFEARAYEVRDLSDVAAAVAHVTSDANIAAAAHPAIRAWRVGVGEDGSAVQSRDTRGGAGGGKGSAKVGDKGGDGGEAVRFERGCDDDGETGASERLLFLLDAAKVDGWVVIVTRWFGGTLLGPARFRHISSVATQLLQAHGLAKRPGEGGGRKGEAKGPKAIKGRTK